MKRTLLAICFALSSLAAPAALADKPAGMSIRSDLYLNSTTYDPKRDPEADLKQAMVVAKATGKRILLDVGGEWCAWCHLLDDYLARRQLVGDAFAASFVIVKVNWSPENHNDAFLSRFPEVDGYPHFFILDASGALLSNQSTSPLEDGDSYNRGRMLRFAHSWGPP